MKSVLKTKSYTFSVQIVQLTQLLQKVKKEYVISNQIIRSGTAIGALIAEAEFGQSRADFIHKMSIALKEANETVYWLSLLKDTGYMDKPMYDKLAGLCLELIKMLVSSVKTAKTSGDVKA